MPDLLSGGGVKMRDLNDIPATRSAIFDKTLSAVQKLPPFKNQRYTLELSGVGYTGPETFSHADEHQALLSGRSLSRRLSGTWNLRDNASNAVLDSRKATLANVPYLTSLGTFINNGNDYGVANQFRLRPGIYAREKENGELESHVNVAKGFGHRYFLDPATGVFRIQLSQSRMPLVPLLKTLGATDSQIRNVWGNELWAANVKKLDPTVNKKIFQKIFANRDAPENPEDMHSEIRKAFDEIELDPEVMQHTLGMASNKLTPEVILAATKKLLQINKGEADIDDRDAMHFQRVMGPEDLFADSVPIARNYLRQLFWKVSNDGHLKRLQPGIFDKAIRGTLLDSGLGSPLEEVNPLEILDYRSRVSRMGRGGIPSSDSIPDDARNVQPSQFGFVDPVQSPESEKIGVDGRLSVQTKKGDDGRIYARFNNAKTGEVQWLSPQDLTSKIVAFPGDMASNAPYVRALVHGKLDHVPRSAVDYSLNHMTEAFGPMANLVPMKQNAAQQRVSMGSRMLTQSLSLTDGEAPLVQAGVPGEQGNSYEKLYGKALGAVHSDTGGTVVSVSPSEISVKGADGKVQSHELYNNRLFNRKSYLHNTPLVQVGQQVQPGAILAKSNYTDHTGTMALGRNLRVAYLPTGKNHNDAVVISESTAKKLTSEHAYQHTLDRDDNVEASKHKFVSIFPSKYPKKILDNFDNDGVIKPGTVVNYQEPLILAVKQATVGPRLGRRKSSFREADISWEHHAPGVVTDVIKTKSGINVVVKGQQQMQLADKLCYSADTDVLTETGWKPIAAVTLTDRVASLDSDGNIEYLPPVATMAYQHSGRMYSLDTTQVNLLVTDNHKLYARPRTISKARDHYQLIEAQRLFGKCYRLKKDGNWHGRSPEYVTLPALAVKAGQFGRGSRMLPEIRVPIRTYAMILGMYLSEGSTYDQPGDYGFIISQVKAKNRQQFVDAMAAAGMTYTPFRDGFRIHSKQWMLHLKPLGLAADKHIPLHVFDWHADELRVLYSWMMWGDGNETGTGHSYCTTSKQLADDVQRLLLHIGYSGNIKITPPKRGKIKGKWYDFKQRYDVRVIRTKNAPEINHGHQNKQNGQREAWEDYDGTVHCVMLPRNHVLYVRRQGMGVWCGNSGLYGDKSTIAEIRPDHKMPLDAQGRPIEVLLDPMAVISRGNPAQVHAASLGKIAERLGKPYQLPDFDSIKDMRQFVSDELKKYGMSELEDLTDPETGQKIPQVLTGNRFIMKLHHLAESKAGSRSIGGYSAEGAPAKGGPTGAKRVGLLNLNALLSHGAFNVARDASVVRGQRNEDYWRQFMSGYTPPQPQVPFVYEKFLNELTAMGIRPLKRGSRMNALAMTEKDIDELAGNREINNPETVDWNIDRLTPIKGGLFDEGLTGGHSGKKWSSIRLHEPMLNPVMEDPVKKILGLTQQNLEDIMAGKAVPLGGPKGGAGPAAAGQRTGPAALAQALADINLDKEIARAHFEIRGTRKTARNAAIQRQGFLRAAKQTGIHPKDWMLSRVPVLPPVFRPVSIMQGTGTPLVSDANYLYRDLIEANDALKQLHGKVDDVSEERLAVYNAFKAVTGMGDPIKQQTIDQKARGILKSLTGSSPKFGTMQRKLLGSTVDLVGRAVIIPNPELDMDEIGVPMEEAWNLYKPFVVRRLVRRGMKHMQALDEVEKQSALAKQMMQDELDTRPMLADRAPVLHRYGVMAFRPVLVRGKGLQIHPLVEAGLGADYDGDAMQFHVPQDEDAAKEALEKMLPSRNLVSPANFKVHQLPSQGYIGGLFRASTEKNNGPVRIFRSVEDVREAWRQGKVHIGDAIQVVNH